MNKVYKYDAMIAVVAVHLLLIALGVIALEIFRAPNWFEVSIVFVVLLGSISRWIVRIEINGDALSKKFLFIPVGSMSISSITDIGEGVGRSPFARNHNQIGGLMIKSNNNRYFIINNSFIKERSQLIHDLRALNPNIVVHPINYKRFVPNNDMVNSFGFRKGDKREKILWLTLVAVFLFAFVYGLILKWLR